MASPQVAVLRDASLEVKPGELIGLVGENGSGKSTLMQVIVVAMLDIGIVQNAMFGSGVPPTWGHVLAIAPATGAAGATGPRTYTVIPKVVDPGEKPGGPFLGQLVRGQTFVVTRLSPSGSWAFGHAVGKRSSLHGWVRSVALKRRSGPQFAG